MWVQGNDAAVEKCKSSAITVILVLVPSSSVLRTILCTPLDKEQHRGSALHSLAPTLLRHPDQPPSTPSQPSFIVPMQNMSWGSARTPTILMRTSVPSLI